MSTKSVPIIGDDSPRARRTDPTTSHEAADGNNVVDSRDWVFELLQHGSLADHELVAQSINTWSASRIRTARHELVEDGLVEFAGIYRLTATKRRAQVWAVTGA